MMMMMMIGNRETNFDVRYVDCVENSSSVADNDAEVGYVSARVALPVLLGLRIESW